MCCAKAQLAQVWKNDETEMGASDWVYSSWLDGGDERLRRGPVRLLRRHQEGPVMDRPAGVELELHIHSTLNPRPARLFRCSELVNDTLDWFYLCAKDLGAGFEFREHGRLRVEGSHCAGEGYGVLPSMNRTSSCWYVTSTRGRGP